MRIIYAQIYHQNFQKAPIFYYCEICSQRTKYYYYYSSFQFFKDSYALLKYSCRLFFLNLNFASEFFPKDSKLNDLNFHLLVKFQTNRLGFQIRVYYEFFRFLNFLQTYLLQTRGIDFKTLKQSDIKKFMAIIFRNSKICSCR